MIVLADNALRDPEDVSLNAEDYDLLARLFKKDEGEK